jgi:DNA invertase Pin-like site-specific DNA recombinase
MAEGKWIAYYRVSTDKQGRSGLGVEAQRHAVAEYLNGGQWKLVKEFTEVESGKRDDNRPQLAEAFKACRAYGAKLVIAKLDRLSRDAHFLLGLQKAGVEFVCVDDPHMTPLTLGIRAVVAQHERDLISSRTKAALAAAKRRGVKLGGDRGVVPSKKTRAKAVEALQARADAKAADLAPIIAELQAAGKTSLRAIAGALNDLGIPTVRGGKWSSPQVMRMMDRPFEASAGP